MAFSGMLVGLWISFAALAECALSRFQKPSVAESTFMAPTGLLSHHSDRRPGWGRDYGPDLDLPKEVSADPFGDSAETTPPPVEQPLGHQVEPTSTPTEAPHYNHNRTVHPADRMPEISPTDQSEAVKHEATAVAGIVDPHAGMPEHFAGSSCEEICATCEISKAQLATGPHGACTCWADCQVGGIDGKCAKDRAGWSDNRDTKPYQEWTGFCSTENKGDFQCSECLSQDFKYELGNCTAEGSEAAICLHKLRQELSLGLGTRTYCTNKNLPSCQEFPATPNKDYNTDDGEEVKWFCFDTLPICKVEKAKMVNGEDPVWDYDTKSVWKRLFDEPGAHH